MDRATIRDRAHLNRLGEREIAAMIDRVTGNKALPESIGRTLSSEPMAFRCSSRK